MIFFGFAPEHIFIKHNDVRRHLISPDMEMDNNDTFYSPHPSVFFDKPFPPKKVIHDCQNCYPQFSINCRLSIPPPFVPCTNHSPRFQNSTAPQPFLFRAMVPDVPPRVCRGTGKRRRSSNNFPKNWTSAPWPNLGTWRSVESSAWKR